MATCKNGHDMDVVGVYHQKASGGRTWRRCAQCHRDYQRELNRRRRDKTKAAKRLFGAAKMQAERCDREAMVANRILRLIDAEWKASTWWERADIRTQIAQLRDGR